MTLEVLAKVEEGLAYEEMAVVQAVAVRSIVAALREKLEASQSVAANLEALDSLAPGDRFVLPDGDTFVLSPSGRILSNESTTRDFFTALNVEHNRHLIETLIRGGAKVLKASGEDVSLTGGRQDA